MKPLNVLYLFRTWAFGGSATIVLLLLKHLPKDRFNVICVPFDTPARLDDALVREAEKRGLPIAQDRVPWPNRRSWGLARDAIAGMVRKYSIDLIHSHDSHPNVLVGIGRKRWPCACVASAYGWWNSIFPLRRRVYQWSESNFALPYFERVITVSEHMKGKILRGRTPEDRIRVINTGLDWDALRHEGDGGAVRDELGIPHSACVVGTVSRVSVEKGHRYLLDAAARLANPCPELRVLIVGDGPERAALEAQARRLGIADRVVFTGFYDNLPGAYAAMDIFALPSIMEEGFPTSSCEAQVAGLPVIASDIGGTKETIDVGATGLLARPGDAADLAEKIRTLVKDTATRRAMAAAARPWIENHFTLQDMLAKVGDTYQEALDMYRDATR